MQYYVPIRTIMLLGNGGCTLKLKNWISNLFVQMDEKQKERFYEYIPKKVYFTERNISILVASLQVFMILLFLTNKHFSLESIRTLSYFCLYFFLLTITIIALFLYRYCVRNHKYHFFLWLRRIYVMLLCVWVIGITFLEQVDGKGIGVYCYLVPTTAAMVLLNPMESLIIFGSNWLMLACLLMGMDGNGNFGNMINSSFVTILALFISNRYYRSTAKEFCDRELIAQQYDEIQKQNNLLQQLVHIDQLTGLYNRHYLLEEYNQYFSDASKEDHYAMLLMMDIDYFKQYNDLYGHVQGDECLKRIANVIIKQCDQKGASGIRYGGEEFLIIKLSKEPFDANTFAKEITQAIKEERIARDDIEQHCVSVSAGLWSGSCEAIHHIEEVIKKADDALYEAKSKGRDCLVQAQ